MRNRRALVSLLTIVLTLLVVGGLSADTGALHQVLEARPISLGTSGGNINDRSTAFCCSGTLGSLVTNTSTGIQYILSNNHVLARTNAGTIGDPIIQPGLIDQSPVCAQDTNDTVANLSAFKTISFAKGMTNVVDAAIAQVVSGRVSSTILDIPALAGQPVEPAIGTAVKKSGRTTGLTIGKVESVNVTISVKYGSTCGGGRGTGTFTNQIRITPGSFSAGGDSGSLVVTAPESGPASAVGLLFAGSASDTFANPIGPVLSELKVSLVGYPSTASISPTRWLAERIRRISAPAPAHAGTPLGAPVNPHSQAHVTQVKERHEAGLMAIPGVIGVGVGASDVTPGEAVIEVYVEQASRSVRSAIPARLEDVPVRIVETGEVVARADACRRDVGAPVRNSTPAP